MFLSKTYALYILGIVSSNNLFEVCTAVAIYVRLQYNSLIWRTPICSIVSYLEHLGFQYQYTYNNNIISKTYFIIDI